MRVMGAKKDFPLGVKKQSWQVKLPRSKGQEGGGLGLVHPEYGPTGIPEGSRGQVEEGDLCIIHYLNRRIPWDNHAFPLSGRRIGRYWEMSQTSVYPTSKAVPFSLLDLTKSVWESRTLNGKKSDSRASGSTAILAGVSRVR